MEYNQYTYGMRCAGMRNNRNAEQYDLEGTDMDRKTENVVQNVGAMAEVTSVFYNSIIKQVPKDVALVLTQHFMDITIARPVNVNLGAAAAAAKAHGSPAQSDGAPEDRRPGCRPTLRGKSHGAAEEKAGRNRRKIQWLNLQIVHNFVKVRP